MQHLNEQLREGTLLDDRYLISRCLGIGGFSITYEAIHVKIGKKVAIKELFYRKYLFRNTIISNNVNIKNEQFAVLFEDSKKRFLKEARILSDFSDLPGIVSINDYFEDNNTAYMVMEYVDGHTIKQHLLEEGPMQLNYLSSKFLLLMDSLSKIHATGIIHKDISPDNIIIKENGDFCLLDFGSAEQYSESFDSSETPLFIKNGFTPIEQYNKNEKLGQWTDVYALSATIYNCITGNVPQNSLQRVLHDELKTPSSLGIHIDTQLENVLMKGLSLQTADRYQSMKEFASDFNNAIPISASNGKSKHHILTSAIIASMLTFLIIVLLYYINNHQEEIKFNGKETEHFLLSASANMSTSEFYGTADQIRERVKILAGNNNYLWKENRDTIEVTLPVDVFEGYDINTILQYYIISPWELSQLKDAKTEIEARNKADENNSEVFWIRDSGKEYWFYMNNKSIIDTSSQSIELLDGSFPGSNRSLKEASEWVYNAIGINNESRSEPVWHYLQISSNKLFLDSFSHEWIYKDTQYDYNNMHWGYSGGGAFYTSEKSLYAFTGNKNDTFFLLLPGHSKKLNELALYNLTHEPLHTALDYSYIPYIKWEEIGNNNILDGANQKNEKAINDAVLFCVQYYNPNKNILPNSSENDRSAITNLFQYEVKLKEKLDYLEIPYSFGYSPDSHNFYIKVEKNKWEFIYNFMTQDISKPLKIYIGNEYLCDIKEINGTPSLYNNSVKEENNYQIIYNANLDSHKYRFSGYIEDEGYTYSERINLFTEKLVNSSRPKKISIYSGTSLLAWCDITKPISNGKITFDQFPLEAIGGNKNLSFYLNYLLQTQKTNSIHYFDTYNIQYVRDYDNNGNISFNELLPPPSLEKQQ